MIFEFFKHLSALLNKRRLYFMRDTRSWIFQYLVPVLFVLIGMLVMRVRNREYMSLRSISFSLASRMNDIKNLDHIRCYS